MPHRTDHQAPAANSAVAARIREIGCTLCAPGDWIKHMAASLKINRRTVQRWAAGEVEAGAETISASLDKLERMNFIVRKPSSVDRRLSGLYLEKKGRSFCKSMLRRSHEIDCLLTRSLSAKERALLLSLLRRIFEDRCAETIKLGIRSAPTRTKSPTRSAWPDPI